MTSPKARSNASYGSADFKMVLQVKLLTAPASRRHCPSWYDASERQYFWYCSLVQISQPETHNWQSHDQKFPAEYQQKHLLRQWLPSSQDRVCYQQCEWDSEPTAHNPTEYKNQEHHAVPISWRGRLQPLRLMSIRITNEDKNCFISKWLYPTHRVK